MPVFFQGAEIEDFDIVVGTVTHVTTAGAFDATRARCAINMPAAAANSAYVEGLLSGVTEFWMHFELGVSSATVTTPSNFMTIMNGATEVIGLRFVPTTGSIGTSSAIAVYRAGTLFGTSSSAGAWATTATKKIDIWFAQTGFAGGGALKIFLNGVQIFSTESLGFSLSFDRFRLTNAAAGGINPRYSQVIVADWSTIGSYLITSAPTGNGNDVAWTGDYLNVDEITLDSTFVTSAAADQRESYTFAAVPTPAANEVIQNVKVEVWAARGALGGPQNINIYSETGGVNQDGPTAALNTTFAPVARNFAVNPVTSGIWTAADLNNTRFGIQSKA